MAKALEPEQKNKLDDVAFGIRKLSLEMITTAGWGHIGGAFSLAELLSVLYFHALFINPESPQDQNRDRLLLSKAHVAPALYAALALRGYFPVDRLYHYCEIGGLDGHTSIATPGVDYSGGSLGVGLAVAVGIALGLHMKEQYRPRVFCILGDGELNEGQIWESAMAAAHFHLDNLIGIVDYNKVGAKGFVHELMSIEPISAKWRAFGWTVIEIDGHDVNEIAAAIHRARYIAVRGKPICIIAHTVKGYGVPEAEFDYHWHTHAPTVEAAEMFLRDLCSIAGRNLESFQRLKPPQPDSGLRGVIEEDME